MGALLDRVIAYTHNETNEINERTNRAGSVGSLGDLHQPLRADHELAELLGLDGSRQQYLGAVDLVAYFSGNPWPPGEALAALAEWWGRDVQTLTAVEWITSAAYADEVRLTTHQTDNGDPLS
jgi:hypothetical protein